MPRRKRESVEQREARAMQYELPAMAAGLALGHLDAIVRLADACEAMYGPNAYTARIREQADAAKSDVRNWQRQISEMLEYPYRRQL